MQIARFVTPVFEYSIIIAQLFSFVNRFCAFFSALCRISVRFLPTFIAFSVNAPTLAFPPTNAPTRLSLCAHVLKEKYAPYLALPMGELAKNVVF